MQGEISSQLCLGYENRKKKKKHLQRIETKEKEKWRFNWLKIKLFNSSAFSSVQFSRSVMSDSSKPHESQHARPPCPSSTPRVHSNSRPSSRWCHPAISSSVVPFSSCPQSLPALVFFPMSQLFAWGGQSIGVSALASVLPKKHPGLISFRMDYISIFKQVKEQQYSNWWKTEK